MSKKKWKIPSSYVIIMAIVVLVAILSWVLPGGAYEYVDPDASTLQPIAGTYHEVDSNPQGAASVIMAPISGFMDSVDIILYTLVIGGYLAVVMKTGAIDAAIGATIRRLKGREKLLIPVLMLIFSFAGAAFGIEEETLPFFPVLIPVLLAAGYDTLVGLSVIKMGAALGVMGSIANPFAVAIASRFAGISMADGIVVRLVLLAIYIPAGIIFTMRYAEKVRRDPTKSLVYAQAEENRKFFLKETDMDNLPELTTKRKLILVVFVVSFLIMIWGVLAWEDLGEYKKAEAYYKKAMDIMEALRPGSLLEIAVTWVNLAVLYEKAGRDGEIDGCLETAVEIFRSGEVPRDGYYAFNCRKCAETFGHFGYFRIKKELTETAGRIYRAAGEEPGR